MLWEQKWGVHVSSNSRFRTYVAAVDITHTFYFTGYDIKGKVAGDALNVINAVSAIRSTVERGTSLYSELSAGINLLECKTALRDL